jgi:molybdate/tungstate transport system substrate-binding protein
MILKSNRRGLSSAVGIAAVIVVIVLIIAAYEVATVSSKTTTTTATSTLTTTVTTTTTSATSISTSTTTSTSQGSTTVTSTSTTTTTSIALAPLLSYSSDSYAAEATALLNGFSSSTGVPVAPVNAGGSFADASAIATGAPDDVFISISLPATGPTYLKNFSSNWAIAFASDQMVLVYSNATLTNSAASTIISQGQQAAKSNATSDWNTFFTALTSGSVNVGISDPVADPAGLRGWLALEAAGYLYSGGNQQAYVSPLLKAGANVTAADAAALVAPLQSGQIQFLVDYKSAAVSAGLGYLSFDPHVSLSDPSLASFYSKFSYTDSAGVSTAGPIILVITVPLSSVNTAEALEFVQYVVKNAPSLASYGLVILPQAVLYNNVPPPQAIQLMLSQGLLVEGGTYP